MDRLAIQGIQPATPQHIASLCDFTLLSLPDGKAVQAVIEALQPHLAPGIAWPTPRHRVCLESPRRAGRRLGFGIAG